MIKPGRKESVPGSGHSRMQKRLWLVLWIAGLLFPLAWLGQFSTAFRRIFDAVFSPLWMHILMHAGLFAVLGSLLTFQLGHRRKGLCLILGVIVLIGLLQEGFQSITTGRFLLEAALFDLGWS